MLVDILGYIAAVIGCSIMIPQVVKIIKTRKVRDISWAMVILYVINCLLWLVYGWLIHSNPVWIANGICLVTATVQMWLKYKYSPKIFK